MLMGGGGTISCMLDLIWHRVGAVVLAGAVPILLWVITDCLLHLLYYVINIPNSAKLTLTNIFNYSYTLLYVHTYTYYYIHILLLYIYY